MRTVSLQARTALLLICCLTMSLLCACKRPDERGQPTLDENLYQAVYNGQAESAQRLIASGANVNAARQDGSTPLIVAAEGGEAKIVEFLLEHGANINAQTENGYTALTQAANVGNVEVVRILLMRNPERSDKEKALLAAARGGPVVLNESWTSSNTVPAIPEKSPYFQIVDLLLKHGVGVDIRNEEGTTPLIAAAAFGTPEVVEGLLQRGADSNAVDNDGNTALMSAACGCAAVTMRDTYESAKLLLRHNANAELREKRKGMTALMIAASWGRYRIVELLAKNRAEIEARDKDGNTALLLAASGGAYPTAHAVSTLIQCGADIEAKDRRGRTPLMLAASEGGYDAITSVRTLLQKGAELDSKDNEGKTALDLASQSGHAKITRILRQAADQKTGSAPTY